LIRTKRFSKSILCVKFDSNKIIGHFIGVAWFGKDEKTRDALDRFHKLIDSEERLVIAVTYSSVQNTESNVGTLLSAADENKQSQKDILGKVEQLSTVVTGKSKYHTLGSYFLTTVSHSSRRQGRRSTWPRALDTSRTQNARTLCRF
jgi:hypothetical protein